VHPHAQAAALAAESAGAQGQFWPMHAVLFENQDALDEVSLREYAVALGIDRDEFDRDMARRRFLSKVREDVMSGIRSGVNGTPTFFINGERYDGPFEAPKLLRALHQAATAHHAP
jgi:protein-disulfide isomerase